ncbi:porin family protein [Methylosinus sp. H3A]|uniref:outer membrane protein n=1 Tax=Methylosinus sp. H3A TaxID=2785786 RepID=UPI0018C2BFC0|nr:outer membrane beta-barrel protein [Methylosinus sp. H3A]MBG0811284.1 porin family protein [Methylosinus sp. H3A]
MKKSLLAASALALAVSAGSALAADLPSKKAAPLLPPPPPPALWTGFYVGLNAGYTWDESSSVTVASGSLAPFNPIVGIAGSGILGSSIDGFIGGGQIGYNYQFANAFVAGIEADIQGVAGSNGATSSVAAFGPLTSTISASKSIDYLGTVRGRLGYLITPSLLVYGTGGLAYGQTNLSSGVVQTVGGLVGTSSSAFSDTRVGWTAGGGVEWLFLPQWSAKVEYLYYDLGTVSTSSVISFTGIAAPVATTASASRFNGHVVRAGVNYHFNLFNAPAPVVAKY